MIKLIFAFVVSLLALQLFWSQLRGQRETARPVVIGRLRSGLIGLLGGIVSGLTGLGGGAIVVTLLVDWLRIPLGQASLYSNGSMFVAASVGAVTFLSLETPSIGNPLLAPFQWGEVNIAISLFITLGSFVSSPWGILASKKIRKRFYSISSHRYSPWLPSKCS